MAALIMISCREAQGTILYGAGFGNDHVTGQEGDDTLFW